MPGTDGSCATAERPSVFWQRARALGYLFKFMGIRQRVFVATIAPTFGFLILAAFLIVEKQGAFAAADHLVEFETLSTGSHGLIYGLQGERATSAIFIHDQDETSASALLLWRRATTDNIAHFQNLVGAFPVRPGDESVVHQLTRASNALKRLSDIRRQIDLKRITVANMSAAYAVMIADLIEVDSEIGRLIGEKRVGDELFAYTYLTRTNEQLSQLLVHGIDYFDKGRVTRPEKRQYIAARTGLSADYRLFRLYANAQERDHMSGVLKEPDVIETLRLLNVLTDTPAGETLPKVDVHHLFTAAMSNVKLVKDAEDRVKQNLQAATARARSGASSYLWLVITTVCVTMVLGFALSIVIIRSLIRPLSRLTQSMLLLAKGNLKVEMHEPKGPDEIGQLSEAVHVFKDSLIQLAHARDAADAANRAKSDFLANMSHEIRTPMNGVLGMAELLDDTPLTVDQKKYVGIVRESGDALLSIVNDILDVSKLDAGKVELECISFDLTCMIDSALALMNGRAREKAIDLNLTIEPSASGMYLGDPARLRQILLNLVGNAIKFTDTGSVSVCVSTTGSSEAEAWSRLRFEVQDTGPGIAKAVCAKLFQKFTQADSSVTRRFGGTGLGLAICRQLVELMEGEIGIQSKVGAGSTFWFELPLVHCRAKVVAPATAKSLEDAFPLRALNILLAEDNKINQTYAVALLQRAGHTVTVVENGVHAVEAVRRADYDVVLMDIQMPELDGVGAFNQIRTLDAPKSWIPVIALTANAMSGSAKEYLDAGMNGYVSKPIRPDALFTALRQAMQLDNIAAPSLEIHDPHASGSEALLDTEKLESLTAILPLAKVQDLLRLYLVDAERYMAAIATCAPTDLVGIGRNAHVLVGTAGNIGAMRMSVIARRLEHACRAQESETAASLIEALRALEIETASTMRLWIASPGNYATAQSA